MKWGKLVLIFQAVITILIGMVFFMQVMRIDQTNISDLDVNVGGGVISDTQFELLSIKDRYTTASYVLLVVALIELLILTRLFD